VPPLIFRKGLDLKHEVADVLAASYHSPLVTRIKEEGYRLETGRLTIHLAREFGFCYGVDRAVDYAYQARKRFPDQRVHLTGEIIHNPHVNSELRAQGIHFLSDPGTSIESLTPDDVVILPAFGITIEQLQQLESRGCTLVDTTCGSVLNVWKNVRRYADEGFTSIIHGKYRHEETQATASQARRDGRGHFLVVLDRT
jgi:4-hydroxy-3-methylbut-2-enyl diphosphate reductase